MVDRLGRLRLDNIYEFITTLSLMKIEVVTNNCCAVVFLFSDVQNTLSVFLYNVNSGGEL